MSYLVTGSSGHLGEALMRTFQARGIAATGLDLKPGRYTDLVGSIADAEVVDSAVADVTAVLHTATLHKPHVATHTRQDFIDTNITGTLNLLEAAHREGIKQFVFTSTTSTFGAAMRPKVGQPAAWVTEDLRPVPRNIYGVTKVAAEDLCELFHRRFKLNVLVLRTSRFFPEEDDDADRRAAFSDPNIKTLEYLNRRVEISDVVEAHLCAAQRAVQLGFGRYIISATSPFQPEDLELLNTDAAAMIERRVPGVGEAIAKLGWRLPQHIDRVYDNRAAREALGWTPEYDFERMLQAHVDDAPIGSQLYREIGRKGYHEEIFEDGPFPVEEES